MVASGRRKGTGNLLPRTKWGTRGAIWFSSRTVQALGAGPMSWSPEMHAYRVAARGGMIRSWGVTGTL